MTDIISEGIRAQRGQTIKSLETKSIRAINELKAVYQDLNRHKNECLDDQTTYTQNDADKIQSVMDEMVTKIQGLLNQI